MIYQIRQYALLVNEVEVTVVKQSGVNRHSETSVKRKTHSLLLRTLIKVIVYTTCEKQLDNEKIIATSFRSGSGVLHHVDQVIQVSVLNSRFSLF